MPSPFTPTPIPARQDLITNTLQQLHTEGKTMGDFDNFAAEMKRRNNNLAQVQARATSEAALEAWEQYQQLPDNPTAGGLTASEIEQDAFTTGYDLGRDSRDAEIATELRLGNLIAWLTRPGHAPTHMEQALIAESLGLS